MLHLSLRPGRRDGSVGVGEQGRDIAGQLRHGPNNQLRGKARAHALKDELLRDVDCSLERRTARLLRLALPSRLLFVLLFFFLVLLVLVIRSVNLLAFRRCSFASRSLRSLLFLFKGPLRPLHFFGEFWQGPVDLFVFSSQVSK